MNINLHAFRRYLLLCIDWVLDHKRVVFLYIPTLLVALFTLYTALIYVSWRDDRHGALEKLAKYKELIDRTEELRKGSVYSAGDVDLTAKVVDIPTRIYDRNNEIIGEFFEQKREIVPFDYIPGWLVKAVVASEDRDFYEHRGINYKGIFRAFLVNLAHLHVVQGGSTITQQLAKVLFTDMDRSMKRKIYESFCAREIEKRYDKQDILSMYLNLIYFGNGAYGVESTAKMFFGIPVQELNEAECSMIVATISNPKIYSPLSNLDNAVRKTRRIMRSMVDAGYLTERKANYKYEKFLQKWDVSFNEKNTAISSLIGSFVYSAYRVNRSPFFNEMVRRVLTEKFGDDVVKRGGLSVYTTIDGEKQDLAMAALRARVEDQRAYHRKRAAAMKKSAKRAEDEKHKADNIEGALVSLDPFTGEVLAWVGGYEFTAANQNDNVSQIRRQPGSSFKPLVYAAAVEDRDITPSTIFTDEKTTFEGGYAPRNYDDAYIGEVTAREALKRSINIVAVKILEKTGYEKLLQFLRDGLHLSADDCAARFQKTLSMALGTYEVSPLENCVLHSLLVSGGIYVEPYGVRYVKDYNGNIVWNNEEEVTARIRSERNALNRIIDPRACAVTVSMLRGVFEKDGTAFYAAQGRKIGFPIAGKTGTSTDYNDAWFLGYTSSMVTAVWIGNKEGAISLGPGRAGGVLAAPAWTEYVAKAYRENPPTDFVIPEEGLSKETICSVSGMVAGRNGECGESAHEQLFYAGTEPGEYCPVHVGNKVPAPGDPAPLPETTENKTQGAR